MPVNKGTHGSPYSELPAYQAQSYITTLAPLSFGLQDYDNPHASFQRY